MKTVGQTIISLYVMMFFAIGSAQDYQPYWEAPPYEMSAEDSLFLEQLERDTFGWFWEKSHAGTGFTPDRASDASVNNTFISVAAVGFGLTAYGIGSERGYITRATAALRVNAALTKLLAGKMGNESQGNIGYKGWFYHFIDANTLARTGNSELSSIDTALLLMGVIFVHNYFDDPNNTLEQSIRAHADSILNGVDWRFMLNPNNKGISGGWFPETGYINFEYQGYSEAIILYILGLGAGQNPLPDASWDFWIANYRIGTTLYFNHSFVQFPPLFVHQYPQAWIDFRGLKSDELDLFGDPYDYFENGRRATYASRNYCAANPRNWPNYGENEWGLTACDGPPGLGYLARGASAFSVTDDGTIAPTAAGGSIAYAPEIVLPALRHLKNTYGSKLYGNYGFRDAYNIDRNWFDADYLGIDQGPILLMIENFRSELVWRTVRQDPIIQRGLQHTGFTGGWLDSLTVSVETPPEGIRDFVLHQNYPNPFNASTRITFELKQHSQVRLEVFDMIGRHVKTLVNDLKNAGEYSVTFHAHNFPSGIYWYRLTADRSVEIKKMLYLK